MPALKQDKEKKQAQKKAGKEKAPAAAGPKVAADKADLRSVMRPAETGPALKVGAANDKAEAEADTVAAAMVAPAVKTDKDADEGKTKDKKKVEEDGRGVVPIRGPPSEAGSGMVRRAPDPSGGQPNLDQLNNVPSLPTNMQEVTVAKDEESDLGDMASGDWNVMAKRCAGADAQAFPLDPASSRLIASPRGGSPLPGALRENFETRLGVDLSGVRVHTGPQARALSARLGARAFAHRHNIWLNSGALLSDKLLMAHEVVHVVQQGAVPHHARFARGPPRRERFEKQRARGPPRQNRSDDNRSQTRPDSRSVSPSSISTAHAPSVRRDAGGEDAGYLARGAESLADKLDSYALLKAIIGRRLFTGETVPPSADGFIGPFMKFIGADETYEQMKQSGSLQRGYDHIRGALSSHDLTWSRVERVFNQAMDDFDWLSPIESFKAIFVPFFKDVVAFGIEVLKVIAEFVAEAFVISFGPQGKAVWEKIKSIGDNIQLVVADPMGFAKNLMKAVAKGVEGFGERIWTHIKAGLLAWVLGPFAAMGIQMPEKLDLKGIVSVILQVLGLTYPQLRPRIVKKLDPYGNLKVTFVEKLIEVVQIMRTEGLAGIWRKLMEYVTNLQTTVINGIRDWVIKAAITAGIRKLVAWSNPAGALIDILLTIYNVICFFVEKFQQIIDFATTVFDAIGRIARGEIDPAASAVEKTLALTIPIIISFLVKLLGLPDITSTVRNIVTQIREKVWKAFDKVLDWVIGKIKKLVAALVSKFRKSNPVEGVPFTLDGHQHTMLAKKEAGKLKLVMRTEERDITEKDDEQSAEALAKSGDKDKSGEGQLQAADGPGDKAAEKVQALSKQPQTQQDLPSKQDEIKAAISAYTTLIEAASKKPADAPPPKPNQPENGPEPPEGAGATDRTDYPFRHVVRLNRPLEGASGSWQQVTSEFNASRDAQPAGGKQDVSRNLNRDHIPEFVLLKKVAQIYLAPAAREGTVAAKTPYPFKAMKENVPSPDTKESNPLLPVMVIRGFINQKVGAQSPLLGKIATDFKETGRGLEPNAAPKTDAERNDLVNRVFSDYGSASLVNDMVSHIEEIRAAYKGLAPGTLDTDAMMATITQATATLKQQTGFIFGQGSAAAYQEGLEGDLKIPLSDVIVENELKFAPYKELGDTGGYLERHHVLEKEVVEAFKTHNETLQTLGGYFEADIDALIETALAGALAKKPKEEQDKLQAAPDKIDLAKQAMKQAALATPCAMTFKQKQGAHDNGMAMFVLNSVNAEAGSQGVAGLDAGIAQLKQTVAGGARNSLAGSFASAFDTALAGGALTGNAARDSVNAALSGSGISASIASSATLQGKGLFGALAGSAWNIWQPLQQRVNQSLTDQKASLDPKVYQERIENQALKRFGELTQSRIVNDNISNWFT